MKVVCVVVSFFENRKSVCFFVLSRDCEIITYLEVQSSPIKENSVKSQKKSQKKLVGEMGETISMK